MQKINYHNALKVSIKNREICNIYTLLEFFFKSKISFVELLLDEPMIK